MFHELYIYFVQYVFTMIFMRLYIFVILQNRKTCQFASAHDNDMNVVNKPVEMLAITTMPT